MPNSGKVSFFQVSEHHREPDGKGGALGILSLEMGDVQANAYAEVESNEAVLVDIFQGYAVLIYYLDSMGTEFWRFCEYLDTVAVLSLYESCGNSCIVISLARLTLVVHVYPDAKSSSDFLQFLSVLSHSTNVIAADTRVSPYICDKFGVQFDVTARDTYKAAHRFSLFCRQCLFTQARTYELLMIPFMEEDCKSSVIPLYSLVALALKGSFVFMIESKFYGLAEDCYALEA